MHKYSTQIELYPHSFYSTSLKTKFKTMSEYNMAEENEILQTISKDALTLRLMNKDDLARGFLKLLNFSV